MQKDNNKYAAFVPLQNISCKISLRVMGQSKFWTLLEISKCQIVEYSLFIYLLYVKEKKQER